jgi:hypothetical protein
LQFRVVPDIIRNRDPVARGRKPKSQLSQQLLKMKTVFVPSQTKKTWGNIYRLAKNHGLRARIRQTDINGEEGYVMWFEDTH